MKKLVLIVVAVVLVLTAMLFVLSEMDDGDAPASRAQNQPPGPRGYVVSTLAGTFFGRGSETVDGPGAKASFRNLGGIALGRDGSLYVTDAMDHKIRKITADGAVSTVAGKGAYRDGSYDDGRGYNDGDCASAAFDYPHGIAVDQAGNIYVADSGNHVIRKITMSATGCQVSTLAGGGTYGDADGTGRAASFGNPGGLAIDAVGNLYVADRAVRKVTPDGVVTTIAASSYIRRDGATSISVLLRRPTRLAAALRDRIFGDARSLTASLSGDFGIAVDAAGNVYVSGSVSGIRKITSDGWVSKLAGADKIRDHYWDCGMAVDAHGSLYVSDSEDRVVRLSPAGEVTRIAGAGGYDNVRRVLEEMMEASSRTNYVITDESKLDGPADKALFFEPNNMVVDANGVIYVADSMKIRKITPQP
jgi:sugar lactone lactonase YvrE